MRVIDIWQDGKHDRQLEPGMSMRDQASVTKWLQQADRFIKALSCNNEVDWNIIGVCERDVMQSFKNMNNLNCYVA